MRGSASAYSKDVVLVDGRRGRARSDVIIVVVVVSCCSCWLVGMEGLSGDCW